MPDRTYFMIEDEAVLKVRIFGVVIERYEGQTTKDRDFVNLTIDDGTDTIRVKVWSRPKKNDEGEVIFNPIDQVRDVKIGHILDVIGVVREYEGEFYVSPYSTSYRDDIEWEIHRRTQIVQQFMREQDLLVEERPIFSLSDEPSTVEEDESEEDSLDEDSMREQILDAMVDDSEQNTVKSIAIKTDLPEETVTTLLTAMHNEGELIQPRSGRYKKIL